MMTAVSLEPYQTNRAESCTRYHNEKCTECSALNKMASHILQEGIVKVCDLYKRQFPSHKYQSDKAVRRLMQLPVVIFKQEFLFVTAYRPMLDYRKMDWSTKLLPGKEIEKLDDHSKTRQVQEAMARAEDIRQSVNDGVCTAWRDSFVAIFGYLRCQFQWIRHKWFWKRERISGNWFRGQYVWIWGWNKLHCTKGQSWKWLASSTTLQYPWWDQVWPSKYVAARANPAPSNDTLLPWLRENKLNWFSFFHELQEYLTHYSVDVLNQVLVEFKDYLSVSDLSEEEEQLVEMSRQPFLEFVRRQPLSIEDEEVFSESDTEIQTPCVKEMQSQTDQAGKDAIHAVRHAIKQRPKRIAAKQVASQIPQRASRIIKHHATIGTDIEDFVKSKRIGADAWRRTGVHTLMVHVPEERRWHIKESKIIFKRSMDARSAMVLWCSCVSYAARGASVLGGTAKITCRKSRKGFAVNLNPDAHWSSAFHKGLDFIQLKDGQNKVLLNRDDQAGFRLDTTFTHREGKCITIDNIPSLTTRADVVNSYPSLLQTTSYLYMESETTEKACIGVVKPHFTFPQNPTQHYADLETLESKLPSHLKKARRVHTSRWCWR